MSQFTVHAAKTNLSKLIEPALSGQDIVIARGTKPVVERKPFKFGILKGLLGDTPDFLQPMSDDDLTLWEGGD